MLSRPLLAWYRMGMAAIQGLLSPQKQQQLLQVKTDARLFAGTVHLNAVQPERLIAFIHDAELSNRKAPVAVRNGATDNGGLGHWRILSRQHVHDIVAARHPVPEGPENEDANPRSRPSCTSVQGKEQEPRSDNIQFQILLDKLVYASGASIEVRFLVTNRGTQPIYIRRNLGPCTGPDGFADLEILDEHGKDMRLSGCAGEGLHHADDELVRWVTGGEAFVLLKPQEIYGSIARYDIRTKPGK
jgi:hypothetical protein